MYSQNIYLKERKGGPRDRRPSFMSYMKSKAAQTILKYEDVNIKNNILLRSLLQITICTKIFQNTLISNLVYTQRLSGITIIRYAKGQKIGKPNKVKVIGNKKTKGHKQHSRKNQLMSLILKGR
jgi:hypothetical protein